MILKIHFKRSTKNVLLYLLSLQRMLARCKLAHTHAEVRRIKAFAKKGVFVDVVMMMKTFKSAAV